MMEQFFPPEDGFIVQSDAATGQTEIFKDSELCVKIISTPAGEIHIDSINKCSAGGILGSGTDNINRLKQFADYTATKLIIDADVSKKYGFFYGGRHIEGVSLGGLLLLSTGQTWYNSHGFLDEDYYKDYEAIQDYISRSETNFRLKNKEEIKNILPPELAEKIDIISQTNSLRNIFTAVHRILDFLARAPASDYKAYLVYTFAEKVKGEVKKMEKAGLFIFRKKFLYLVYDGAAAAAAAPAAKRARTESPRQRPKTKRASPKKKSSPRRRRSSKKTK